VEGYQLPDAGKATDGHGDGPFHRGEGGIEMGKLRRPTLWIPLAFLTLAAASALVWSAFVSSAPTEATILVRRAGMPVAGVRVAVFLVPLEEGTGTGPAVGVPTTSPALARGETAADGRFTAALDMVPTGRLADPGDGTANAFNTIVVAEDPSGGLAIRHEIMRVGERNPVVIDLDAQGGTTSLVQP